MNTQTTSTLGVDVTYEPEHNGGGIKFYPEFVELLSGVEFNTVCEYCCGPSFIGFALLKAGVCENLILVDINPAVKTNIEKSLTDNNLDKSKVIFLVSDRIKEIRTKHRLSVDLFVSNRPHIDVINPNTPAIPYSDNPIIYSDPNFMIHAKFFEDLRAHFDKAKFLFIENGDFSSLEDSSGMHPMVEIESSFPGKYYIASTDLFSGRE